MENVSNVSVVRNYKDTVFRMIFKERRELLELYNAVNGTDYDNAEKLVVQTLENAVYMGMKNDVSCILDMRLQLYEQQSSVNPNMPLRDLIYLTKQYEKLIIGVDIYSSRLIKLPTPKFFVFYNGVVKQPEIKKLKLSDAFEIPPEEIDLELVVTQLNINEGYNECLKEKCPTLLQYMTYVNKVRVHRQMMPLSEAVPRAIDECIREDILKEFLLKNKAEVTSMSIFEYDEELHKKTLLREGYEDGFSDGQKRNLISLICRKLAKGQEPGIIAEDLLESVETIEQICEVAQKYAPNYDVDVIAQELKDSEDAILT